MKKQICILTLVLIFILSLSGCTNDISGVDKPLYYNAEKVARMFKENFAGFKDICKILISKEDFRGGYTSTEDTGCAITYYSDATKIFFSDKEWSKIKSFVKRTRPFEISMEHGGAVEFYFINESNTKYYVYSYCYENSSFRLYHEDDFKDLKRITKGWFLSNM